MNSIITKAHYVMLPTTSKIAVAAVTTSSQSLDLTTRTEIASDLVGGRMLAVMVEQATWLKFGIATGTADNTAVTGANQTWYVQPGLLLFGIPDGVASDGKFWVDFKGAAAGYIRFFVITKLPT